MVPRFSVPLAALCRSKIFNLVPKPGTKLGDSIHVKQTISNKEDNIFGDFCVSFLPLQLDFDRKEGSRKTFRLPPY